MEIRPKKEHYSDEVDGDYVEDKETDGYNSQRVRELLSYSDSEGHMGRSSESGVSDSIKDVFHGVKNSLTSIGYWMGTGRWKGFENNMRKNSDEYGGDIGKELQMQEAQIEETTRQIQEPAALDPPPVKMDDSM